MSQRVYPPDRDGDAPFASSFASAPPDWLALSWLPLFAREPGEGPGQLLVEVAVVALADAGLIDIYVPDGPLSLLLQAVPGAPKPADRPGGHHFELERGLGRTVALLADRPGVHLLRHMPERRNFADAVKVFAGRR